MGKCDIKRFLNKVLSPPALNWDLKLLFKLSKLHIVANLEEIKQ